MTKDNLVYIKHILDCIEHIESFLAEINFSETTFAEKLHWQNAFYHEIQIIGEAASHIDQSYLSNHPNIPWQDMIGMGHKLVHDYFEVNMQTVWDVATIDIPQIKPLLQKLIS